MSVEVYTTTRQKPAMGGGGGSDDIFEITSPGRNLKINSISFDWKLEQSGAPNVRYIPATCPNFFTNFIEIGTPLVQPKKFNKNPVFVAGNSVIWLTDTIFLIFSPGQYLYNSFFVNETLGFRYYQTIANGAAGLWICTFSITIEVETINAFFE